VNLWLNDWKPMFFFFWLIDNAQGDWGTKLRVGTALSLLVGAKVWNHSKGTRLLQLSLTTCSSDSKC
jgi:hypothetical protein